MKNIRNVLDIEGDPLDHALKLLDQLFPFIPEYNSVNIELIISKSNLTQDEKLLAYNLRHDIEVLLFKLEYIEKTAFNPYYGQLTNKGRDVKSAGGHFAYFKKLGEEKAFQKRKEEIDLKSKEWVYKYRRLPFIFSGSALVISIVALIFTAIKYFQEAPKKESNFILSQPQIKKLGTLDTLNNKSKSIK